MLTLVLLVTPLVATAEPGKTDLQHTSDPGLQKQLGSVLDVLRLTEPALDGRLSVALIDITDPYRPKSAFVNSDQMMYAASLPKLAILLGVFDKIEKGEVTLDDELRAQLTNMIRYSSNSAATAMLEVAGKERLPALLQSPRYKLYDPRRNGGLWVGKEYGKGVAYARDPLHNLSHGATAFQVARFYFLMETGQLVSNQYLADFREILSAPGINHKFVKGLLDKPGNLRLYRKSGTWQHWHADSILVEHNDRRYIAVALAEDPQGGEWMTQLISAIDDLMMSSPKTTHIAAKR